MATYKPGRSKQVDWNILTIKIMWVVNVLGFGIPGIGVSGEGGFFYAIFYAAIAFPSSIPVILLVGMTNTSAFTKDVLTLLFLLLVGYVQWFVVVPYIVTGIKEALEEYECYRCLAALGFLRKAIRWFAGGALSLLALFSLLNNDVTFIFTGQVAIVVFLLFRKPKN